MEPMEKSIEIVEAALAREQWELALSRLEHLHGRDDLSAERRLWVYDTMGFVLYQLGRIAAALACCDQSLALAPDNAYAHKGRGICLAAQGRVEEGVRELLQAIAAAPSFFDAYHDLAVILLQTGDIAGAKPWAQRAYQLNPVDGEALLREVLARHGGTGLTP